MAPPLRWDGAFSRRQGYDAPGFRGVKYRPGRSRRWWIGLIGGITILIAVILVGLGLLAWELLDNIGSPGPSATGSGPCGSSDAVNLHFIFADGGTANACTRDRPHCGNERVDPSDVGQGPWVLEFTLQNQLRSSSRRYVFFLQLDAALPAETGSVKLPLTNLLFPEGALPDSSGGATVSRALVDIRPRDPDGYPSTSASGSLTISSSKGVARGQIDGELSADQGGLAAHIAGSFTCNR